MRAECPDCHTKAPVRVDGSFAHHTRPYDLARCAGVDKTVVLATAKADAAAPVKPPTPHKAPAKKTAAKKAPAKKH